MRIVRHEQSEWSPLIIAHRGGGLEFKDILVGDEARLDNYWLTIVRGDGSFYSPRHRHNFDQVRICLEGRTNIDPKKYLVPGEIGYFPEGAHYGPQQDTEKNLTLVLQFGAAGGGGFLGRQQVLRAQEELGKVGQFNAGVFQRVQGPGKKNQDSFEAIWEHVTNRKLSYSQPRFDGQIYMKPENFHWRPTGSKGVYRKTLGVFTERETRVESVKIEAGVEWISPSEEAVGICFIMKGDGSCENESYGRYTTIETLAHEQGRFVAMSATEMVRLALPPLPEATLIGRNNAVAAE